MTNLDSGHASRNKGELVIHIVPVAGFIILILSLIFID